MKTIPQRELRNRSGAILREAEAGEEFTITVGGRPVATLSGYHKRQWLTRSEWLEILATPTDEGVMDDLVEFDNSEPRDPWNRE